MRTEIALPTLRLKEHHQNISIRIVGQSAERCGQSR
jgi:hypothetical protein